MRIGAVFLFRKTYVAVPCSFPGGKYHPVRCGGVNRTEPHQTDRKSRSVKNPGNIEDLSGNIEDLSSSMLSPTKVRHLTHHPSTSHLQRMYASFHFMWYSGLLGVWYMGKTHNVVWFVCHLVR